MKPALHILAGPLARARLRVRGLAPADVLAVPGAAGGPKGLILNPLDRFLFGHWLAGEGAPVHLLGASIGAWRMASACLPDAAAALAEMARHYVEESYLDAAEVEKARASGRPVRPPDAAAVSRAFRARLASHLGARTDALLTHPRFRLHLFTSRGVHPLLRREGWLRTLAGYAGAYAANLRSRARMGGWLERVVFSDARDALPFALDDYAGRTCALGPHNSFEALVASCSIPFWLQAVHDIPGAPPGAYWDGGITDYHLHLDYASALRGRGERVPGRAWAGSPGGERRREEASSPSSEEGIPSSEADSPSPEEERRRPEGASLGTSADVRAEGPRLVLYPHFQPSVVPGWLDKSLHARHGATARLDNVVLLVPDADWIARLPNAKLPDRRDFKAYGADHAGRAAVWRRAIAESERLADEFAARVEGSRPIEAEALGEG